MSDYISFKTHMDEKSLYRFQLYSVYHNIQGVSAIIISVMCFAFIAVGWNELQPAYKVILAILGLIYLVFKPVSLRMKAKLLVAQQAGAGELEFTLFEDHILVSQGEQSAELKWEDVYRIVVRKDDVYVYSSRIYAYIIPKEQTGEKWKALTTKAEKCGCKIV